jgi:hypothetical protein
MHSQSLLFLCREANEDNAAVREYAKDLSETRVLVDALTLHFRRFSRMWPPLISSPSRVTAGSSPGMHTLMDRSAQTDFPQCPNSSPGPLPKGPKPQSLRRTFSAPDIGWAQEQGATGGEAGAGMGTSLLGAFAASGSLWTGSGRGLAHRAMGVCLPSPRRGPLGVYEALVSQSVDGDAFGASRQMCGPWGSGAGSGPLDASALYEQVTHSHTYGFCHHCTMHSAYAKHVMSSHSHGILSTCRSGHTFLTLRLHLRFTHGGNHGPASAQRHPL